MKIGIITWFTGSNYGTNLQAIALQRYLRNMGYEVLIINYEVNDEVKIFSFWQKIADRKMLWTRIKRQPEKYAMKRASAKFGSQILKRNCKLSESIEKQCILTEKVQDEERLISILCQFDLLITGSDQIWNPGWYHRFYYADYDEVKTEKISYAPSLGVNAIAVEKQADIKRSLRKFKAVSVREKKGAELLRPLMNNEPEVVVDPTLLLDAMDWEALFPKHIQSSGEYVLSMFLTDNRFHWRASDRFAKENGLRHVVIPYSGFSYFQKAEIKADAGMQEFLDLIRGAKYILTDSFHVTALSIINRKQFYTFTRFREDLFTSQNERLRHILTIAGIKERLLPYGTKRIPEMYDITYKNVEKILDKEIERSKKYLLDAIKK